MAKSKTPSKKKGTKAPAKKKSAKKVVAKKKAAPKKKVAPKKAGSTRKPVARTAKKNPAKKTIRRKAVETATKQETKKIENKEVVETIEASLPPVEEKSQEVNTNTNEVNSDPTPLVPGLDKRSMQRAAIRNYNNHHIRLSNRKGGIKPSGKKPLW